MNAIPPPSDEALSRDVRDECTRLERRDIVLWLSSDYANLERVKAVAKVVAGEMPGREWDPDAMWTQVFSRSVAVDIKTVRRLTRTPVLGMAQVRRPKRTVWLGGGLAGAAVVVVVTLLILHRPPPSATAVAAPSTFREYVTRRGERTVINLADGTLVMPAQGRDEKKKEESQSLGP